MMATRSGEYGGSEVRIKSVIQIENRGQGAMIMNDSKQSKAS